jgi:hypothetical protein
MYRAGFDEWGRCEDRQKGFVVAFGFSSDAEREAEAFRKKTGRVARGSGLLPRSCRGRVRWEWAFLGGGLYADGFRPFRPYIWERLYTGALTAPATKSEGPSGRGGCI